MTAGKIFICHRRGDAVRQVGGLLDKLSHSYDEHILYYGSHKPAEGKGVSMDGLHAMVDARAVLILIGPTWASLENLERLHETDGKADPLRRWIALALTRHGTGGRHAPMLLPVLLDGASMPDKASLPKDLKALAKLTPMVFPADATLSRAKFDKLTGLLNRALGIAKPSLPPLLTRLFKPFSPGTASQSLSPFLIRLLKPLALALVLLTGSIALTDWLGVRYAAADSDEGMRKSNRVVAISVGTAAPTRAE